MITITKAIGRLMIIIILISISYVITIAIPNMHTPISPTDADRSEGGKMAKKHCFCYVSGYVTMRVLVFRSFRIEWDYRHRSLRVFDQNLCVYFKSDSASNFEFAFCYSKTSFLSLFLLLRPKTLHKLNTLQPNFFQKLFIVL